MGPIPTDPDYVHIREFFERIFEERAQALEIALHNLEFRLAGLNELRAEVLRDRAQFIQAAVYHEAMRSLLMRVEGIEKQQARWSGIAAVLIIIASLVSAMAVRFLRV